MGFLVILLPDGEEMLINLLHVIRVNPVKEGCEIVLSNDKTVLTVTPIADMKKLVNDALQQVKWGYLSL